MAAIFASTADAATAYRYVALGDSYTAGTGALPQEAWPVLVTERLKKKGYAIELVANLGRNGWTAQDLFQQELPEAASLNPNLVSLLIGTNDWVHGISKEVFEAQLIDVLDHLLKFLKPAQILVLTIPDFSVSPAGAGYSNGRNIAQGLSEFNEIILKEAGLRGLKVVNLYPLSQKAAHDRSLFSADGLHPSAKGYAIWAEAIEPQLESLFK